jgi:uncharacterized protein (TIGR00369 family)
MTDTPATTVPEGFEPHYRKSPVTDPWEPLYSRRTPGQVEIGVRLASAHCNSRGLLHGGVIAALADNAMGLALGAHREAAKGATAPGGAVTTTLNVDYLASAKVGAWLQVTPRVLRSQGSTGVVDALVHADETLVARANAVFRVLDAR